MLHGTAQLENSINSMNGAGFPAHALRDAGFDMDRLRGAGFDASSLREAGFNASSVAHADRRCDADQQVMVLKEFETAPEARKEDTLSFQGQRPVEVSVFNLSGLEIAVLAVSQCSVVRDLKLRLTKQTGIPQWQQHLLWQMVELADEATLLDIVGPTGTPQRVVLQMVQGGGAAVRVKYDGEWCDGTVLEISRAKRRAGAPIKVRVTAWWGCNVNVWFRSDDVIDF